MWMSCNVEFEAWEIWKWPKIRNFFKGGVFSCNLKIEMDLPGGNVVNNYVLERRKKEWQEG
jgi:hypothetical protein